MKTKSTFRWNLAIGLLWLVAAARDQWFPRFLSMTGSRHGSIWFQLCAGVVFVSAAGLEFRRMRRARLEG